MKKIICTVLLVSTIIAVMALPVMAGRYYDKITSSYKFSSFCSNDGIEAATLTPKGRIQYNFSVSTDTTKKKYVKSTGSSERITVHSAFSFRYHKATEGYVIGTIDGDKFNVVNKRYS